MTKPESSVTVEPCLAVLTDWRSASNVSASDGMVGGTATVGGRGELRVDDRLAVEGIGASEFREDGSG